MGVARRLMRRITRCDTELAIALTDVGLRTPMSNADGGRRAINSYVLLLTYGAARAGATLNGSVMIAAARATIDRWPLSICPSAPNLHVELALPYSSI